MGLLVPVSACFGDGHGSIIALNEFVSWSRVAGEEKGGQVLTVQWSGTAYCSVTQPWFIVKKHSSVNQTFVLLYYVAASAQIKLFVM